MDLIHELCPVQLLEVTKKSDNLSVWLASIQHLAHIKLSTTIYFEAMIMNTIFSDVLEAAHSPKNAKIKCAVNLL